MSIFGEVQQRMPRLQKSKNFVFFAPHTSEHPAVLPLISELSGRMGKASISSESVVIEDMRESVVSVSSKLSRIRWAGREREALEKLFKLKDALVRLEAVTRMLTTCPQAVLLEVHALDRDYDDMDPFGCAGHFYRFPNTRVLYLRNHTEEYEVPIVLGTEALAGGQGKATRALKDMLGLDIARVRKEAPGKLEMLGQNAGRILLMEIPAPVAALPEDFNAITRFETAYGYGLSLRHTLAQNEIDSVFSALVRP